MQTYPEASAISDIVERSSKIIVIQADNPDADSLASALALEQIFGELGKEVVLFCGVDLPGYLMYLPGADRVTTELPSVFDASLIVDTSSDLLLEQLSKTGGKNWLAARPAIVIDHHQTAPTISFAKVICNHPAVATGEIIYNLARQLNWPLNLAAKEMVAVAILSDSLGLTSEATTAAAVRAIADLVDGGVNLAKLDNARRATQRREAALIHYKGRLLQRVEFFCDERIATVTIPLDEIEKYSPLYNPSMLVLDDMRLALKTKIAIAFKVYGPKRITAKIRTNWGAPMAGQLAEKFGGGGHSYASGFKILNGAPFEEVKRQTIEYAEQLLNANDENL